MTRTTFGFLLSFSVFMLLGIIFLFTSTFFGVSHTTLSDLLTPTTHSTGAMTATGSDTHPEFWSITYPITFSDSGTISQMRTQLDTLKQQALPAASAGTGLIVQSRTVMIDHILQIAGLYENLGQTGQAIKVLEENFAWNIDKSFDYNNRLATLYQKIATTYAKSGNPALADEAYTLALARFQFLTVDIGDYTFLQRVATIWYDRGDRTRGDEAMRAFEAFKKKDEAAQAAQSQPQSLGTVPVQNITVGSGSSVK